MQKTILSLAIGLSFLLGMSACQPKSDASSKSNEAKDTEQVNTPTPIEKSAATSNKPTDSALDAKTCLALNKSMQKVDDTSKIDTIYEIQKQLTACLPTANSTEALSLLKDYQAMYGRFLAIDSDINAENTDPQVAQAYYDVMSALEMGEQVPVEALNKLSPRTRYLISLIKSDADVRARNLGEGFYTFAHDLQAMADIFIPYLRPDQKAFIGRMAKDNQEVFWSDAAVTITFDELIERAIFWEDYIQRYPSGYAVQDAKVLLNLYRYVIFFGSDNTRWTDNEIREFIKPDYKQMIVALTKRPNSILAKDAENYLNFMALSDSERQELYPASSTTEDGYELNEWEMVYYRLNQAMQIPSIWKNDGDNRECLEGLFCQTESFD
ncbi:hypothetical protein FHS24_001167 [Psychrobacter luti]|uniref:Uncharacterized protein n=1 Tax=Psychrobacter luti TaxID=198481 RepID=A0A839TE27_9GAMM|nr:hypothetical protein [Psychrobacter luti]MBB3106666.1 hypothetical protein [Psychrobacter luti]